MVVVVAIMMMMIIIIIIMLLLLLLLLLLLMMMLLMLLLLLALVEVHLLSRSLTATLPTSLHTGLTMPGVWRRDRLTALV